MEQIATSLLAWLPNAGAIVVWIMIVMIASLFLYIRIERPHNVSVIGFPEAGKTTLLDKVCLAIYKGRIYSVDAQLAGRETLKQVEAENALLEQKIRLGSTQDQDMRAYRTKIKFGSFLNKALKTYAVNFGDFDGKDSKQLSEGNVVHPTFARWVNRADAFIFAVDVMGCLKGYESKEINKEYVRKATAAFKSVWGVGIKGSHTNKSKVEKLPVVLVFTKSDLFNFVDEPNVTELVQQWGKEEIPPVREVDRLKFHKGEEKIMEEFKELRTFFAQTSKNYRGEVFVSSFGDLDGHPLGFDELLLAVLPK